MCSSGDCLLRCANGARQICCRQGKKKGSSKGCPKRSQGGKGRGGLQGSKSICQTKSRSKENAGEESTGEESTGKKDSQSCQKVIPVLPEIKTVRQTPLS